MLSRLSDASLTLRIGLGAALLAGLGSSWVFEWGWISVAIAAVVGILAAYLSSVSR